MPEYLDGLLQIARCEVAQECRNNPQFSSPCRAIIDQQSDNSRFHIPEPWSGHLDQAPLLFISSNPSLDFGEMYPDQTWSEAQVVDFFHDRFSTDAQWVNERWQTLKSDGSRGRSVSFWGAVHARAREIWSEPERQVRPGLDYVLTEVVHCKSKNEKGVRKAAKECAARYLDPTLRLAAAKVCVVLGSVARNMVVNHFKERITYDSDRLGRVGADKQEKLLVFLPHPNAWKVEKDLKSNIGSDGLAKVRAYLD